MSKLALIAAFLASSTPALASPVCDLIKYRAEEQSDILRSPTAIAGVGDESVAEQNAIAGVQISFADRKRAGIIDSEAQVECQRQIAVDRVAKHLRYAAIDMAQAQAGSENKLLADNASTIEGMRGSIEHMVGLHQTTIVELNAFENLMDGINAHRFENDATLSAHNDIDRTASVAEDIEHLKRYTHRMEELSAAQQRATSWDVSIRVGGRQPLYGMNVRNVPDAFIAAEARYSFGGPRSSAAGRHAADAAVAALKDDPSSVVEQVEDLRQTLVAQLPGLDQQIERLKQRIAVLSERETRIAASNATPAVIAGMGLKVSRIQAESALEGLVARKAWIGREVANLTGSAG